MLRSLPVFLAICGSLALAAPAARAQVAPVPSFPVTLTVDEIRPNPVTARLSTGRVTDPQVRITVTPGFRPGPFRVLGCLTAYRFATLKCRSHTLAGGSYTMALSALTGVRLNASHALLLPAVELRADGQRTFLPTAIGFRTVW